MQKQNSDNKYKVLQLYNDWEKPEDNYETPKGCHGVNIDITYLEQETINETQASGNFLGVWYRPANTAENQDIYDKIFGKTGKTVDFFYSDKPQEAMAARDII